MSAHTPGPWKASLDEFAFTNGGERAVIAEASEDKLAARIALVSPVAARSRSTKYNAPDPDREANARLIAAAPELLAALKRVLTDMNTPDELIALADASQAIAKAEGRV